MEMGDVMKKLLTVLIIWGSTAQGQVIGYVTDPDVQTEDEYFATHREVKPGIINEEFRPYLNGFVKEAKAHGVSLDPDKARKLSMEFSFHLASNDSEGQCNQDSGELRIVESYWITATEAQREMVVYHELGHCLLGRGHEDGQLPLASGGYTFKSIMNTYPDSLFYRQPTLDDVNSQQLVFAPKSKNNFYNKFHEFYMNELFGIVIPHRIKLNKMKHTYAAKGVRNKIKKPTALILEFQEAR